MTQVAPMPREAIEVVPASNRAEAIRIAAIHGRAVLWLKSWLPEHIYSGKPLVLAGLELPSQVGTALSGPVHALCLGPGEWLTISHERTASNLREHFASDLTKYGLAVVDLSDGLAVLEVSGSFAYDTLSKGCGLDLHPCSLADGQCARTCLAQIPVVLEYIREPPRFELYVARSYLEYLRSWLTDAAAEFQGSST